MVQKATIFKAEISISDMDRNYYQDHNLTLARHPSETDERMMLRIVAFIQNAHEFLSFSKGISDDDEPDLWQKNYSDQIELWIELGQPSEQRIKKGCNQAEKMMIYSYADNSFTVWWSKEKNKLSQRKNLSVVTLPPELATQLSELTERNMQIQVTIQDGQMWLNINNQNIEVSSETLL